LDFILGLLFLWQHCTITHWVRKPVPVVNAEGDADGLVGRNVEDTGELVQCHTAHQSLGPHLGHQGQLIQSPYCNAQITINYASTGMFLYKVAAFIDFR
jgi:hypothetical protein